MARVTVIGAPFHSGGEANGVAGGVGRLRAAGLLDVLRAAGHDVTDLDVELLPPGPDRDPTSQVIHPRGLSAMIRAVAAAAEDAVAADAFPLVVGGDCPVLLGGLIGSGTRGLIHVDGHEDAYTPQGSPTGASADSEIAFATGIAPFSWDPGLAAMQPLLAIGHLAILGARDLPELDAHGVASLRDRCTFADDTVVRADAAGAARRALEAAKADGFWLHLDWDVLANDQIGSVIFPLGGGLTWEDLSTVVRTALADPGCRGWSASTYNPDLDPEDVDAVRIVRFIAEALGSLDDRPTEGS
jgi:arginase